MEKAPAKSANQFEQSFSRIIILDSPSEPPAGAGESRYSLPGVTQKAQNSRLPGGTQLFWASGRRLNFIKLDSLSKK